MVNVTQLHRTTEAVVTAGKPAKGRSPVRVAAAALTIVFAIGAVAGRFGYVEWDRQKSALRLMRLAVEESLAPGEVVVVDDRLLGWALRRGSDGVLRDSVWSVSEDEPASSLLARLRQAKAREVVVVATPDDRLIRHLDDAGFTVAQEVGWVSWDLNGDGMALLGRGRKRIFFAVTPSDATGK